MQRSLNAHHFAGAKIALAQVAQLLVSVNSGGMAVAEFEADRIATDDFVRDETNVFRPDGQNFERRIFLLVGA